MFLRPFKIFLIALAFALSISESLFAETQTATGKVESLSSEGRLSGWARLPHSPNQALRVQIFVGGPKEKPGTALFFETTTQQSSGHFEILVPEYLGDDQTHQLYVYAVNQQESTLLESSPFSIRFKTKPRAQIRITHPQAGESVAIPNLEIRYEIIGDTTDVRHVHWRLDEQSEVMDLKTNGSFSLEGVKAGQHTLHGYIAKSHHDKVINTDVSVQFTGVAQ